MDFIYGLGLVMLGILIVSGIGVGIGGLLVIHFIRTRRIVFPRLALTIIQMLEIPIKNFLAFAKIDTRVINDMDAVDLLITKIRNLLLEKSFKEIPYKKRVLLLPQCLRSEKCPAKLGEDGIECLNCGKCELGQLKKDAEKIGYRVFIVTGGSFVKRMMRKYKPQAVLGVGCHMELKEGGDLILLAGLTGQGVPLTKDGCFKTQADFDEIRRVMKQRD